MGRFCPGIGRQVSRIRCGTGWTLRLRESRGALTLTWVCRALGLGLVGRCHGLVDGRWGIVTPPSARGTLSPGSRTRKFRRRMAPLGTKVSLCTNGDVFCSEKKRHLTVAPRFLSSFERACLRDCADVRTEGSGLCGSGGWMRSRASFSPFSYIRIFPVLGVEWREMVRLWG